MLQPIFGEYCSSGFQYQNQAGRVISLSQITYTMDWFLKSFLKDFFVDEIPQYILFYGYDTNVENMRKLNASFSDELELIGVVDADKTALSGVSACGDHYWAWIKDEFDTQIPHRWYKRDDRVSDNRPAVVQQNQPQNFKDASEVINNVRCPLLVLYKKTGKGLKRSDAAAATVKQLGEAFASITGAGR